MKLLMDEALRVIWPERKSHARPQRLIWSGGLRVEDAVSLLSDLLLMDEALRVIWLEGNSHAELQRLIWSGELRIEGLRERAMLNLSG